MSWDVVGVAVDRIVADVVKAFVPGAIVLDALSGSGGQGMWVPLPQQPAGEPGQGPPPPPAPPAPLPPGAEGPAAEAATESARRIGETLEQLATLDQAGISPEAIAASGEVGRKELEDIRADVTAKIGEMKGTGALFTPEGQFQLADYIKTRLQEAKGVIEQAAADAEDKAGAVNEQAERYRQVADSGKPQCGCGGDHSGGGGAGIDGGGAASAAGGEPTEEAAADTAAAGQPMTGIPMGTGMPGLGGGIPGLGGGGLPGLGGGGLPGSFMDPLGGALGNLGQAAPQDAGVGFSEEPVDPAVGNDDLDEPEVGDGDGTALAADHESEVGSEDGTEQATEPATAAEPPVQGEPSGPPPKSTDVQLPSGDVVEARSAQGAQAVQAALNGAPVSEAWQQAAGIALPPAGTPVTDPVPPTKLMAGDVGMWKDHQVLALGNGKVLVSGQEQPLESVGSGPDFLGWFDPTAARPAAPPAD